MIPFTAQIGPILEATKTALTADQINLMLVVIVVVVAAQTFQAWRYSISMDKLRWSVDGGFQSARADQHAGNHSVNKLAGTVEIFTDKMMQTVEGFVQRMTRIGQQMDAGFEATATTITAMQQRLDEAAKAAARDSEKVITEVRASADQTAVQINLHTAQKLGALAESLVESLDVAAAGVRQAVGDGVDSLLKRQDDTDAEVGQLRETAQQMVVIWSGVDSKLTDMRGEMVGKHEFDVLAGRLDDILKEVRMVMNVQSIAKVQAADVVGGDPVGGAAVDSDSHPCPVGQPDAHRDLVLHEHAGCDVGDGQHADSGSGAAGDSGGNARSRPD